MSELLNVYGGGSVDTTPVDADCYDWPDTKVHNYGFDPVNHYADWSVDINGSETVIGAQLNSWADNRYLALDNRITSAVDLMEMLTGNEEASKELSPYILNTKNIAYLADAQDERTEYLNSPEFKNDVKNAFEQFVTSERGYKTDEDGNISSHATYEDMAVIFEQVLKCKTNDQGERMFANDINDLTAMFTHLETARIVLDAIVQNSTSTESTSLITDTSLADAVSKTNVGGIKAAQDFESL